MEQILRKDYPVDVICQHKTDGSIIPLRIRLQDEDGVYQVYQIRSYKDITHMGKYRMPNDVIATNHMWYFECRIAVFHVEKRIRLLYNSCENLWKLSYER